MAQKRLTNTTAKAPAKKIAYLRERKKYYIRPSNNFTTTWEFWRSRKGL